MQHSGDIHKRNQRRPRQEHGGEPCNTIPGATDVDAQCCCSVSQLGKKPLTGKEKRKQKRDEFKVAPEWFGETPEERTECRSQEEALLYMKMGGEPTEVIRKPEEDFVKKIVDDL